MYGVNNSILFKGDFYRYQSVFFNSKRMQLRKLETRCAVQAEAGELVRAQIQLGLYNEILSQKQTHTKTQEAKKRTTQ